MLCISPRLHQVFLFLQVLFDTPFPLPSPPHVMSATLTPPPPSCPLDLADAVVPAVFVLPFATAIRLPVAAALHLRVPLLLFGT